MEMLTCTFESNVAPTGWAIYTESEITVSNATFIAGNPTHIDDAVFIFVSGKAINYGNCTTGSSPGEAGVNAPAIRDFTGCPFLCPNGTSGTGGETSLLRDLVSGCSVGCAACPPGATCESPGLPTPTLCKPGHYNPDPGSTTANGCRPCESGSFQTKTGATTCDPCQAGEYIATKGSTACSPCRAGGYCEEVGASSASVFKLCGPGTWSAIIGLNNSNGCRSCGVGTYQPITGASSAGTCLPCPIGTASQALGMGACNKCAAGTFQDQDGQAACVACEPGSYCPAGASAPLPCAEGSHSSSTSLTSAAECTPADVGHYASTGSTQQAPCSPGTVAPLTNMGACELCEPGKYQPNKQASSCLPCADENLGVYCPNEGTSTATPCPGGTHSNTSGLNSEWQCTPVQAGEYAPTGSKFPEKCPASGFTCPGRAVDEVNSPPGSKPILVDSGQSSVDVEMEAVTFDLEVEMRPEDYDQAAVIAELAALYEVSADLFSVEVASVSDRRKLAPDGSTTASSSAQRLRLKVTILVLTDSVDTESSLTVADGASSNEVSSGVSTAGRLAKRLAAVNSLRGSGLSAALGFNVTLAQGVLVATVLRQISASCPPGYWCSAANAIPCVPNTFQPEINQIDAGACQQCPEDAVSPKASKSIDKCKCKPGYYDSEPAINKLRCMQCKTGSDCTSEGGTTLETLPLLKCYYRTSSTSDDLRRCPDCNHNSGCVGGVGNGEGPCKDWLEGPYCRLCNVTDTSHYYDSEKSECLVCEGNAVAPLLLGCGLLLAIITIVLLLVRFWALLLEIWWLERLVHWLTRLHFQLSLRSKCKQLLGFYQALTGPSP